VLFKKYNLNPLKGKFLRGFFVLIN